MVDYSTMTKAQLIAELKKRDAEIAAMKADADTSTILKTKLEDLRGYRIELIKKKQQVARMRIGEMERIILLDGLQTAINEAEAKITKLENILAKLQG